MKNFTLCIILFALLLSSCSTEKKLSRAINKHGQKESVAFIVKNYPEYFKYEAQIVHDTVPVIITESKVDTTFIELRDTITIQNERIKVVLQKTDQGWNLSGTVKADTVFVPVQVQCPPLTCPDMDKIQTGSTWTQYLVSGSLGFMLALIIIYLLFSFAYSQKGERGMPKYTNPPAPPAKKN
jgi:hypothetical protein